MSKYKFIAICALLLCGLLLAFSMTTTVGYNEVAVKATFGSATQDDIKNAKGDDPGLWVHLPPPFQNVYVYDRRVQVLEERLEEQQTLDKQGIVAATYVNWRIKDPLEFYQNVQTVAQAKKRIVTSLRDARSVIGNYSLGELTSPEDNKIAEVEGKILAKLKELENPENEETFGVEILEVGLRKLLLPEPATQAVFKRMSSERTRLAQDARSAGENQAKRIKAQAKQKAERIVSEANRIAEGIRTEAQAEIGDIASIFRQDPELAIFLRKLDTYREVFKKYSTFFIDADQGFGSDLFQMLEEAKNPSSAGAAKK
ncbi:MAG: protease modulator HflC [Phycisphaeraceae bacterium]|nr:protease modulator HflC [Phycisphaeraceae bacterium]